MKQKPLWAIAAMPDEFTPEAMAALAASAAGAPISLDFDPRIAPVGRVVSAHIDEQGRLLVEGELFGSEPAYGECRLVPAFCLPTFRAIEFGLTHHPSNSALPPISWQ